MTKGVDLDHCFEIKVKVIVEFVKLIARRQFLTPLLTALFLALLVHSVSTAQQPHTLTGDIRVHKSFHSSVLNNTRDVIVYLPPGYAEKKNERYPVFYMHDGQNLFDGATSFIGGQEWRADETAQALIESKQIEPLIIVGIYNAGKDRINEYTPEEDANYKAGGQADLYGRMLVEELKPFIDKNYRTRKNARDTALGGSSLGGIVSLYLGLKYKDVFGNLAVISPSVWFANKQIVRFVEAQPYSSKTRIWLDIGTKEDRIVDGVSESVTNTRLLKDVLLKKGWKLDKDLRYLEDSGAEHNERAWAGRFDSLLKFFFSRKN